MIRIIFLSIVLIFLSPYIAQAQSVLNIKADINTTHVPLFGYDAYFNWKGAEIEYEYEFKKNKLFILSGFAAGVRREEENYYDGTYVFIRTYNSLYENDGWEINLSGSVFYGYPGIILNRAWQNITPGSEADGYISVFPIKAFDTPGSDSIKKMGIIYPTVSLSIQKDLLWHFSIEPTVDLRLIKFGLIKSGSFGTDYREKTVMGPSFGLRLGYRF